MYFSSQHNNHTLPLSNSKTSLLSLLVHLRSSVIAVMMAVLLQATVMVAFVAISCQAFVPIRGRARAWITPRQVSVSSGMEGYHPHQRSNHTARDVLESLDFLANMKHRAANEEGVSLFEAFREVVEDDEEEESILVLEATTNVNVPESEERVLFETTMDSDVDEELTVVDENDPDVLFEALMSTDIDALHQVSNSKQGGQDNNKAKKENDETNDDKASEEASKSAPGIGGSGGTVYDVNRLKTNLVQDMMERSKAQLFDDLGMPSVDISVVEDKLASMVQSNAVKCTTDSNLLDGEWTFAFGSRQSASALMDPNRFDFAARRTPYTQVTKSAKKESPFRSSTRTFYLEDMLEEEDAHVLDRTRYFGGIFGSARRYNITRLTRTSLKLDPCTQQWSLFGKCIREKKSQEPSQRMEDLRILYVDNDLCLSASDDLEKSPFHVYTKSKAWVGRKQRMKRNARRVFNALARVRRSFFSVLFLRKRVQDAVVARVKAKDSRSSRMLVDIDDETKRLTVLKLGDLENDANAWDGEDDPFVHLTADERQEKLKNMRVRDVHRAGRKQKKKKIKKDKGAERRKQFKKPE